MLKMFDGKKAGVLGWLAVTFLFGAGFIAMEIYEFHHLISEASARSAVASCRRSSPW